MTTRIRTAFLLATIAAPVAAQSVSRESLAANGAQGNDQCFDTAISADGRFVAFDSRASNLVPGDTNGKIDIFVRDRLNATIERVSVASNGVQADGDSDAVAISGDGRYVAFVSEASNLVAGDTNGVWDVFVRDRRAGTTLRVSVDSAGVQGDANSLYPAISRDGRIVAFSSFSHALVPGDTNGTWDEFVRDLSTGVTTRVSVDSNGGEAAGISFQSSLSADGRFVAFSSTASNLVAGDTNHRQDVFLHDRASGATTRVSVDSNGVEANDLCESPVVSGDGRFVVFRSRATNLTSGVTGANFEVFRRDVQSGVTALVSIGMSGAEGHGESLVGELSSDGRFVAFASRADDLVPADTNLYADVFVRDCTVGTTTRESLNAEVESGNADSGFGWSELCSVSMTPDGRIVAFSSNASNLVPADTNFRDDVFVRQRVAVGFSSVCDPGVSGGAVDCPCSNPPAGAGRGCDNSSVTGGAVLAATGIASLAVDNLVFTASREKPSVLSVLLQGTAGLASGAVYGQGVRCVGGAPLLRLFTKQASRGAITAPELGAGDPSVSARSAALGDAIGAGETRWYLVYYRDPIVLDLCPPTSTFNATQTGRVDWSM